MTNYVVSRLQPGETLVYRGRPSRFYALARPTILLIITLIIFGAEGSGNNTNGSQSSGSSVASFFGLLFALVFIIALIRGIIFLRTSEYVVTDRRVVGKYGGIRTHSVDVMMTNIAGADIRQGFFARIFRYGNVIIKGSGSSQILAGISGPTAFQHAVYQQLEMSRLLKGTAAYTMDVRVVPEDRPTPPPPPSAPSTSTLPPPPGSQAAPTFCAQCGKNLTAGARFCASCSAPVAN